ncbi:hypothetical protein HQ576_14815 [bacterium]|nr:hypothetical protein [bacterium]
MPIEDKDVDTVEAVVQAVRRRLGIEAVLRAGVAWLGVGLAAAVLLVLGQRLIAFGAHPAALALVPVAAGALLAAVDGLRRWPAPRAAAFAADALLHLHERLAAAWCAGAERLAGLLRADAERHASHVLAVHPDAFAVRRPARLWVLPLLALALLVALLLPSFDLLGWQAARAERAQRLVLARQATYLAADALRALAAAARRRGLHHTAQAVERAASAAAAAPAQQAPDAAATAQADLRARLRNTQAARDAASDPAARKQLNRDADLLAQALRRVDHWRRDLAGGALQPIGPLAKDTPGRPSPAASPFVHTTTPAPAPAALASLERRLLDARPAVEAAMTHDRVPWGYRAIVRRYFTPSPRPPRH